MNEPIESTSRGDSRQVSGGWAGSESEPFTAASTTRAVSLSIVSSDLGTEACVRGTDYRDVLRKIDRLRAMALESLKKSEPEG
jgi:hypothetical protein